MLPFKWLKMSSNLCIFSFVFAYPFHFSSRFCASSSSLLLAGFEPKWILRMDIYHFVGFLHVFFFNFNFSLCFAFDVRCGAIWAGIFICFCLSRVHSFCFASKFMQCVMAFVVVLSRYIDGNANRLQFHLKDGWPVDGLMCMVDVALFSCRYSFL